MRHKSRSVSCTMVKSATGSYGTLMVDNMGMVVSRFPCSVYTFTCPASTRHGINVELMLAQRRKRWTNNNPELVQYLIFAGWESFPTHPHILLGVCPFLCNLLEKPVWIWVKKSRFCLGLQSQRRYAQKETMFALFMQFNLAVSGSLLAVDENTPYRCGLWLAVLVLLEKINVFQHGGDRER